MTFHRILSVVAVLGWSAAATAAEPTAADIEFFEIRVRPIFAAHCQNCHGNGKDKGGLVMTSRSAMMKGGDTGPAVVPGQPDKSLLVAAIHYTGDVKMPPKGKLQPAEIDALTEWVKRGAPWPPTADEGGAAMRPDAATVSAADRAFWSFQPVADPLLPKVKDASWPRQPLDFFIRAAQEAKGVAPVRLAEKRALIRRATFDLTGLPPTPAEIEAFLADDSPAAFERVVDRLLASPHYGERWARYWLDLARYGEDQAHTFQARLYPQGWRYRDYVINAFNADKPYDRFLIEQLAGDLLSDGDPVERLAATGLFATGPVYYADAGEARAAQAAELDDRLDVLGRGILGLTVACARCHDHKFDPIPTKDYYSLAGVFNSTQYREAPLVPDAEVKRYEQGLARIKDAEAAVNKFLAGEATRLSEKRIAETAAYLVSAWKVWERRKVTPNYAVADAAKAVQLLDFILDRWVKYLADGKDAKRAPFAAWTKAVAALDPKKDHSTDAATVAALTTVAEAVQTELLATLAAREEAAQAKKPLDKPRAEWLAEMLPLFAISTRQVEALLDGDGKKRLQTLRSEVEQLKKSAPPKYAFAHALTEGKASDMKVYIRGNYKKEGEIAPRRFLRVLAGDDPPPFREGSGRLELARVIASPSNPLTARVFVNRVWMHHFGRGLVVSASNFGRLGTPPTHPELLDHLATRFVRSGWSVKALHREILLSATYRLAADSETNAARIDPANTLFWRANRRRLDVEAYRDALLAVTGQLDLTPGGPSRDLADGGNRRRTVYAAVSRHNLNPLLRLFDFPDPNVSSEGRPVTTVPLQQLFVLNSDFMIDQARGLARRLEAVSLDPVARIRAAFLLLYGRPATEAEVRLATSFLDAPDAGSKPGLTRWEQYAQVLLAANEFTYLD